MTDIRALHPILALIGNEIHARRLSYAEIAALMGGAWGDGTDVAALLAEVAELRAETCGYSDTWHGTRSRSTSLR